MVPKKKAPKTIVYFPNYKHYISIRDCNICTSLSFMSIYGIEIRVIWLNYALIQSKIVYIHLSVEYNNEINVLHNYLAHFL